MLIDSENHSLDFISCSTQDGHMIGTMVAGFALGISLIVAIGAQNAYVLRQGVRREHVGTVVVICMVSDALLIVAGTAGIGTVVTRLPWVLPALTWLGVAYLIWFGLDSLRSAYSGHALSAGAPATAGSVVATTLALTYLNPHVYVDTVVMVGNLANQHGADQHGSHGRWWFAAGAALGSVVWFSALGFGARILASPLGKPSVWRGIDILIALVMFVLAAKLASGA
jgi:L-lysine exporter family protein LysE/ArgO